MSAVARAIHAWGEEIPDWVRVLAEQCERGSQVAAAELIGYSSAVVNQVISKRYKGDLGAVEQAIKGALMHAVVPCPVAGDLPAHRCLEFQRQPFAATNPQRVALFRACRGCQHNRRNV